MNIRTLALTTTSLVVLGMAALPASAGMMGDVRMGYGHSWLDADGSEGGENSYDFENEYPSILGQGRVNLPYSNTVNIQLDAVGRASLDDSVFGGKNEEVTDTTHFALGGHINYRDEQGLLGVFAGVGRLHDDFIGAPVFLAGLEGQYFCEQWTLSAQVGYMDSDRSFLLRNAGYLRAGATYYSSKKLKFTAGLAYIDGEALTGPYSTSSSDFDVEQWAWTVGVHHWFGTSIPVSGFVEYRGRTVDLTINDFSGDGDEHTVNAGVTFHFGGDGFIDADRNGASTDLPDLDWYRVGASLGGSR